jgi:hypothetical protein
MEKQTRLRVGPILGYLARSMPTPQPSARTLIGIALILAIIVLWAAFVASLSPFVGKWPVLAQAPYYLFVGVAWAIPLKPLIRWIQTGRFRVRN